jgi:hypothetical protein
MNSLLQHKVSRLGLFLRRIPRLNAHLVLQGARLEQSRVGLCQVLELLLVVALCFAQTLLEALLDLVGAAGFFDLLGEVLCFVALPEFGVERAGAVGEGCVGEDWGVGRDLDRDGLHGLLGLSGFFDADEVALIFEAVGGLFLRLTLLCLLFHCSSL